MKKSIKVIMGLVVAALILVNIAPTNAEATRKDRFTGNNVRVGTVKKHTKSKLKGTVIVTTEESTAPKKALIVVTHQGTRYKAHHAKLIHSVELFDDKGEPNGKYDHIYSFHGSRTKKY